LLASDPAPEEENQELERSRHGRHGTRRSSKPRASPCTPPRSTLGQNEIAGGAVDRRKIVALSDVTASEVPRIKTGIEPIDSVFGGGIVPSTTVMLAATAGCGKSRLMLRISSIIAKQTGRRAYYIGCEQPAAEIRLLCEQLNIDNTDRINVLKEIGGGADIDEQLLKDDPPCIFVVDSINDLCGKDDRMQLVVAKRTRRSPSATTLRRS
jgi:predicted ATP-dependent serine protease